MDGLIRRISSLSLLLMPDQSSQIIAALTKHSRLLLSFGPFTGALIIRRIFKGNKPVQMVVFGAATLATINAVLGPYIADMAKHWQDLRNLIG